MNTGLFARNQQAEKKSTTKETTTVSLPYGTHNLQATPHKCPDLLEVVVEKRRLKGAEKAIYRQDNHWNKRVNAKSFAGNTKGNSNFSCRTREGGG